MDSDNLEFCTVQYEGGEYVRNFIMIVCTCLFVIVLPQVVHATDHEEGESEEKPKKGLVRGLVHQVKDTVEQTVQSTGDVVEETVKFTGDTVERTVNMTADTVKTVVDPKQEKPVKTIVDQTTQFVGETVESTTPVVKQTTQTVQTVTNEMVQVTKPLPKVPVVTDVVDKTTETVVGVTDQVKETVDKTVSTVTETVSKPLKKPDEDTQVVEEKPVRQPSVDTKPIEKPSNQPSVTEKPVQDNIPVVTKPVQQEKPVAEKEKVVGSTVVTEAGAEESPATPFEKATSRDEVEAEESQKKQSYSAEFVQPMSEAFTMERKVVQDREVVLNLDKAVRNLSSQAFPLRPSANQFKIANVQLITGASSTVSASSASSGMSGIGAILGESDWMFAKSKQHKWYLEDSIGVRQWSHAPPGQPPKFAPFLYVM